ncbi:uncharacterized protein LOC134815348 isoform X2 [Bolinopsis microptera]|uniref:uncharacterized protein LOC134815348 isoform X2 n=1 Tax=Bolinopsis microptera TaxID=2820187 RepID=UPI00307ABFE1
MANLKNFVMEEADRQFSSQEDGIDSNKMENFYNSALSSIKQMNSEVAKCADKREKLYSEYGAESFAAWRKEHSGQVLTQHQQALVEDTEKTSMSRDETSRTPSAESR